MDLNPFGGNFNVNTDDEDKQNTNILGIGGDVGAWLERPFENPLSGFVTGGIPGALIGSYNQSNRQAFEQQQNLVNQQIAQQDRLTRDEQNRRWQQEISSSWAAYGVQRRSQIQSGGGSALGPTSATDLYLGGR